MDPDVMQQVPGLVAPASVGELRPEILAIHKAQQANLTMQVARQRRNQERQTRRQMGRAGQPATPITAGAPAFNLASPAAVQPPPAPPIQCEIAEPTRSETPPIISDSDFNMCAICLDNFVNDDKIWRPQ
eukprot:1908913-Pyramimonas_sp.AAC.1